MVSVALISEVLDLEIFKASNNTILKYLVLLQTKVVLPLQKLETDLCQFFLLRVNVCESFLLLFWPGRRIASPEMPALLDSASKKS